MLYGIKNQQKTAQMDCFNCFFLYLIIRNRMISERINSEAHIINNSGRLIKTGYVVPQEVDITQIIQDGTLKSLECFVFNNVII